MKTRKLRKPLKIAVMAGSLGLLCLALLQGGDTVTLPVTTTPQASAPSLAYAVEGSHSTLFSDKASVVPEFRSNFPKEFGLLEWFYQAINDNKVLTDSQLEEKVLASFRQDDTALLALGEHHGTLPHQQLATRLITSLMKQNGHANIFVERLAWPALCPEQDCSLYFYKIPDTKGITGIGIGESFETNMNGRRSKVSMDGLLQHIKNGKPVITYTGSAHVHTDKLKFTSNESFEFYGRKLKLGPDTAEQMLVSAVAEKAQTKGVYVMMHSLEGLLNIADEAFLSSQAVWQNFQQPSSMRAAINDYLWERAKFITTLGPVSNVFVYSQDRPNAFYGLVNDTMSATAAKAPIVRSLEGVLAHEDTVKLLAEQQLSFAKFYVHVLNGNSTHLMVFQNSNGAFVNVIVGSDYKVRGVGQIQKLPSF